MKKLKVIHFISSLKRGGREKQLCTIYKFFNPQRQEIKILYLNDAENNYIEDFNIKTSELIKVKSQNTVARFLEISRIFKLENPDVVYAWGELEATFSLFLNPFHRYVFINGSIRHGLVRATFTHKWRTFILKLSKNIIANSNEGLLVNGLKKGKVLFNGIDDVFFANKLEDAEISGLSHRLKKPILISVANLVPYKDYKTILKALEVVKSSNIDFSYIIIGEGPMKNLIIEVINHLRLNDEVLLYGVSNKVNQILSISDVFIHSSMGEGCSNAIVEAMASGLPIIASNTGGTSEIVKADFGCLFQYQNYLQLADQIIEMLSNENLINKMGQKAKEYAKTNHSASNMVEKYHNLIEDFYLNTNPAR